MKRLLLAVAFACIAGAAPAFAQQDAQEWTKEEQTAGLRTIEYTRFAVAGKQLAISIGAFLDTDCRMIEGQNFLITKPPEHGTAIIESRLENTAYKKDNPRFKCNEKKVPMPTVIYKADDQVGTDTFETMFIHPNGQAWLTRYTIKIVDGKQRQQRAKQ